MSEQQGTDTDSRTFALIADALVMIAKELALIAEEQRRIKLVIERIDQTIERITALPGTDYSNAIRAVDTYLG